MVQCASDNMAASLIEYLPKQHSIRNCQVFRLLGLSLTLAHFYPLRSQSILSSEFQLW